MELCALNLDTWIRDRNAKELLPFAITAKIDDPKNLPVLLEMELWGSFQECLTIMVQVNVGLREIHNHKLIHRDLNPRNSKSFKDLKV